MADESDDPRTDPRIGTVLQDRYRILSRLGKGGMGVVYRGERIGLGRWVAIKFLRPDIGAKKEFRERFEREAMAMSRLHHPHCVPVIDYGIAGSPYIVLEYVTGESLTRVMRAGPMPAKRAIAIVRQVLAGLAHAHGHGIIHRDVKPDNVILGEATGTGDHARVLDFGLAKVSDSPEVSWSTSSIAVGTPGYMSPEQARGEEVDPRTDIYSCGVMLFQMLTGRKPFVADNPMDVLRMHASLPPPRLADAAPGKTFPRKLEEVVARALAKYPDERFDNAIAFSQALAAVGAPLPEPPPAVIKATRPKRADEAAQLETAAGASPRKRDDGPKDDEVARGGAGRLLLVLLLLAGAGGGGWYAYQHYLAPAVPIRVGGFDADPAADAALPVDAEAPALEAAAVDAVAPDAALPLDGPADAAAGSDASEEDAAAIDSDAATTDSDAASDAIADASP